MKKCPNCGAEISDEARYCIHCMTPLISKQAAKEPKQNYARVFIAAGVAAFLIAASVLLILFLPKMQPEPADRATDPLVGSEDAETTESASEEETETSASESKENLETTAEEIFTTAEDPCRDGHDFVKKTVRNATCTAEGEEVLSCTRCGTENSIRLPALGHQFRDATCLSPKTCARCNLTSGAALGHLVKFGICGRCGNEVENAPRSAEIASENARHAEVVSTLDAESAEIDASEASVKAVFTRYSEPYPPKKTMFDYLNLAGNINTSLREAETNLNFLSTSDPNYYTKRVQLENIIADYRALYARYDALYYATAEYDNVVIKRSKNEENRTAEDALHEANLIAIDDKYR